MAEPSAVARSISVQFWSEVLSGSGYQLAVRESGTRPALEAGQLEGSNPSS